MTDKFGMGFSCTITATKYSRAALQHLRHVIIVRSRGGCGGCGIVDNENLIRMHIVYDTVATKIYTVGRLSNLRTRTIYDTVSHTNI